MCATLCVLFGLVTSLHHFQVKSDGVVTCHSVFYYDNYMKCWKQHRAYNSSGICSRFDINIKGVTGSPCSWSLVKAETLGYSSGPSLFSCRTTNRSCQNKSTHLRQTCACVYVWLLGGLDSKASWCKAQHAEWKLELKQLKKTDEPSFILQNWEGKKQFLEKISDVKVES